jgi:glycosyltransferase involved in cell wall biosynthesis
MRYVREAQPLYEAAVPGGRLGRLAYRAAAGYLRRWDRRAGARPHALIANSRFTRDRIGRYYGRDAQVIAPPIDTARFAGPAGDDPHAPLLVVSALVPNKRVELAVRAFAGRRERLLVVGEGAERARLERLAGENVTFLGWVDDDELTRLYAGCRALLHPGVEDFGMVLVEAMAAGKPVIACNEGGAPDVVVDGETGLFMNAATIDALRDALDRLAVHRFDAERLRKYARGFDRAVFRARFAAAVEAAA